MGQHGHKSMMRMPNGIFGKPYLNILNKGNEPTFVISNRKEVIGLTLHAHNLGDLVTNWHASDEIYLSDHRYILFQVGDLEVTRVTYHNPK